MRQGLACFREPVRIFGFNCSCVIIGKKGLLNCIGLVNKRGDGAYCIDICLLLDTFFVRFPPSIESDSADSDHSKRNYQPSFPVGNFWRQPSHQPDNGGCNRGDDLECPHPSIMAL